MTIISMFDESGNALRPWAMAGHHCHAFDWENEFHIEIVGKGSITYYNDDLSKLETLLKIIALKPKFVMGFPDCTHLAVSGTRSWKSKRTIDPNFQHKAVALARTVEFHWNDMSYSMVC